MKTTTITVRIRLDQAIEIEHRKMNVSEFLRERLDEEFGSNDFIKQKEKELTEQLKKIKQIKKQKAKVEKIPEKEKIFFKETKEVLKKNPGFLQGRINLYKNLFGKTISIKRFREMVK